MSSLCMNLRVNVAQFSDEMMTSCGELEVLIFKHAGYIRECASTPCVGMPHPGFPIGVIHYIGRANTNHFRCNSLVREHFRPKF